MRIVDRGMRAVSVYKIEIISSAFKWLIVLRSAIKTRDQTHRVLTNASQRAQADRYCLHSLCEPRIDTCCSVLLGPLETGGSFEVFLAPSMCRKLQHTESEKTE